MVVGWVYCGLGFFCFGEDIHTKERARKKEGGIDEVENNK